MPGLLPPSPAAADDAVEATEPEAAVAEGPAGGTDAPADGAEAGTADSAADTAEPAAPDAEDEDADPAAEDEDRGEPLFEVSDRRATILADKVGIVFRLDEEEADFTWEEIGAVEIDTPRFAKRFKVTVYTGPRRWFEAHVEAPSRSLLKKWAAELDAVLDEHFEDPDAVKDEAPKDEDPAVEAAEDAPEATETEATEAADAEDAGEAQAGSEAEAEDKGEADAEDAGEGKGEAEAPADGAEAKA